LAFSKIEQMPDVNVSVTREENTSATLNGRDSTGVGLSVSIPLFNRNQEKTVSAHSKINAQKYELEFRTNQLINLISNDINEFEVSLKLTEEFPAASIKKILTNLNQANGDFKRGVLDFITYIELDSQEYQMIDTVIDTQVQVANSYAGLMTKIGNFILPENEQ
jgi:outer membrane protein TolC